MWGQGFEWECAQLGQTERRLLAFDRIQEFQIGHLVGEVHVVHSILMMMKRWLSSVDSNKKHGWAQGTGYKDDGGTWTRRRTRMLTKMRPSSSPSRPSPPTPSSSPSSDLSLWSVDNDKEEEEDGDENAKGGHQVDTWTDSRNVKWVWLSCFTVTLW